ncbi:CDP-diacylglycerol--glycerol-3-phosphate 3-phosphatidyltransferase isoform X1 [Lepisosteus oculatus]|uniref:CDP-diacylglycerol--glycerol-3-phosphate 3-phosphatidyltransferase isoform X1 n=1 Tax=Lepisosteus oculatus TaxID=7918 RepID=UPI00074000EE|nr:PREDICTED: CDP-diacylglycerol--inositol 3-phosphatidyltransferase [Lepisosteus oculatus]
MGLEVLLFVPNVIGYIRVLLLGIAWAYFHEPEVFIPCYVISIILDGVDGWAARRLNQTSEFGAWLDVVVDNLGRGMLWSMLFEAGWLVAAVEWCVFVCTHSALGAQWKSRLGAGPPWVQAVMANGFKTPPGVLAIGGLHVLPVWLYGYQRGVLTEPLSIPAWLQGLGAIVLIAGRLLCFTVEVWCIWMHIRFLTRDEKAAKEEE